MKIKIFAFAILSMLLAACGTQADVASRNLSLEAGEFKVVRRVVFYNGITDAYILTIEGRCQIDHDTKLSVTCKTGENQYKKHYLGLSDNVTYSAEQLESSGVSTYRYKVLFKPEQIVPDVDVKISP